MRTQLYQCFGDSIGDFLAILRASSDSRSFGVRVYFDPVYCVQSSLTGTTVGVREGVRVWLGIVG